MSKPALLQSRAHLEEPRFSPEAKALPEVLDVDLLMESAAEACA